MHKKEPVMGIELMTSSLPRMRSTPELHRLCGAENEVRTRDPQLGRLMLYQLSYFRITNFVGGEGFEPPKASPADLQSAPVGHFGILPICLFRFFQDQIFEPIEGFEPTTPRLQITCSGQLSYIGNIGFSGPFPKGIAKIGINSYSPKLFAVFCTFSSTHRRCPLHPVRIPSFVLIGDPE